MDEIETYDFGLRLKKLRKRKRLSQTELAKKVRVTKSTIYRYENNTLSPSLDKAILLAQVLDTTLDYLAGLDKTPAIKIYNLSEEEIEWLNNTIRIVLKHNSVDGKR